MVASSIRCQPHQRPVTGLVLVILWAMCALTSAAWAEFACSGSGTPCTSDADCNACSTGGGPCLTGNDCVGSCSGSGAPCVTNQDCPVYQGCLPNTCLISGETCEATACNTTNLVFSGDPDKATFAWDAPASAACGTLYDCAKGDLAGLGSGWTGQVCIEDNGVDTQSTDPNTPLGGEGYWYLSRIDGDTWNTSPDSNSQQGDRDVNVTVCP